MIFIKWIIISFLVNFSFSTIHILKDWKYNFYIKYVENEEDKIINFMARNAKTNRFLKECDDREILIEKWVDILWVFEVGLNVLRVKLKNINVINNKIQKIIILFDVLLESLVNGLLFIKIFYKIANVKIIWINFKYFWKDLIESYNLRNGELLEKCHYKFITVLYGLVLCWLLAPKISILWVFILGIWFPAMMIFLNFVYYIPYGLTCIFIVFSFINIILFFNLIFITIFGIVESILIALFYVL